MTCAKRWPFCSRPTLAEGGVLLLKNSSHTFLTCGSAAALGGCEAFSEVVLLVLEWLLLPQPASTAPLSTRARKAEIRVGITAIIPLNTNSDQSIRLSPLYVNQPLGAGSALGGRASRSEGWAGRAGVGRVARGPGGRSGVGRVARGLGGSRGISWDAAGWGERRRRRLRAPAGKMIVLPLTRSVATGS